MKPFKKWTAAIERYAQEKEKAAKTEGSCKDKTFNKCHYTQWMKFLATLMGKSKLEQVNAVNAFMNRGEVHHRSGELGRKAISGKRPANS